ncbi:MAG: tRNA (adenosine(37)-N6)-threonylcarbamoyltransferase complex dimerization subunit type 1 TsaB [Pseudorhodoplanes sp.]|nr:tRNA (adenosine(37)-N6)-threonylcarbamoyltransferase complex dimerization subunit type 1 TsaB [Pseudorhodoplanes sp.]
MRVLAIDTALEACSAALLDTEQGEIVGSESRPMARGHAEAIMPLIARLMDKAGLEFDDIDRIAVTTGPGSFTGLRVGISAARGIGLAARKPVVGLTTLAALAAPYIAADDTASVASVIDARHDHVYVQMFGPGGRTLVSARIATLREATRFTATGLIRIVGSGARLLLQTWPRLQPLPLIDERRAPDIGWVARLGAAADESMAAPKPLYLRAPDAQPQDAAQLPRR